MMDSPGAVLGFIDSKLMAGFPIEASLFLDSVRDAPEEERRYYDNIAYATILDSGNLLTLPDEFFNSAYIKLLNDAHSKNPGCVDSAPAAHMPINLKRVWVHRLIDEAMLTRELIYRTRQ